MSNSILVLRESNKPTFFHSKKYGTVKLRSFISLKDFQFLLEFLRESQTDSRQGTIQILNHFILEMPSTDLSSWDNRSLMALAQKWADKALKKREPTKILTFEDFIVMIKKYVIQMNESIRESIRGISEVAASQAKLIANAITPLTNSIAEQMSSVLSSMKNALASVVSYQLSIIPKLSDLFETIEQTLRETNDYIEVLERLGYEHAATILEEKFSRELLRIKPDRQKSVITKKLINITTDFEFAIELERLFGIPQLRGRWRAIKQALQAHQTRQYFISIPVFLAQAEGIFTELLIMRNLAYKAKSQIFALENGSPKKNTKEKVISLHTLNSKVVHARGHFDDEKIIRLTVDVLVGRFIAKRNDILHGRINNYGNAETSTQTLLLVYTLAGILEKDAENSKPKTELKDIVAL